MGGSSFIQTLPIVREDSVDWIPGEKSCEHRSGRSRVIWHPRSRLRREVEGGGEAVALERIPGVSNACLSLGGTQIGVYDCAAMRPDLGCYWPPFQVFGYLAAAN